MTGRNSRDGKCNLNAATVQGTLASAIGRITGEKVLPQGSGRTDAGVHALAQVVTFVTEVFGPHGEFSAGVERYFAGVGARDGGCRGAAGVSCAAFRPGKNLPVSHLSGGDLSAVSGALCLALSLSAERECDGAMPRGWWSGENDFTSFAAVDPGARARRRAGLECADDFFIRMGTMQRRIRLHRARVGILTSHGPESGRDIHSGGQSNASGTRHHAHSRGPQPVSRRERRLRPADFI